MTRRFLPLLALCAGCLATSAERAERDRAVGRAATAGLTVSIDDGYAAVRALGQGRLELWSQAPVLGLDLASTSDSDAVWTLAMRNVMPGSELRLTGGDGVPVAVPAARWIRPTVAEWQLTVPAGAAWRGSLAPADAEARETFRFAVMSDVQDALPLVGDVWRRMNEDPTLRFVFCAGDLTENGQRPQLVEFQERMSELDIPLYGTVGNHELFTVSFPWTELFGRANVHYVFKGVHFTVVDSGDGLIDTLVYRWLDGWLAAGRDSVHIFGTHIPPFDPSGTRSGAFGNRNEAAALLAKLADAGVDLTVYGHVHSYHAFSNAGIPAYISGGGGAIPEQFDGIGRHFLTVTVDPARRVETVAVVRVD